MSKIALSSPISGTGIATIQGPELTSDALFTLPQLGGEILTSAAPVVLQMNGGQLAGHRNKLINPFSENQRAYTAVGDDTYCLDRWYVLSGSGNVNVAQVVDPEPGAPYGIRLTQPDVSAKRFGLAQIIESANIRQYASQAMNLSARVKLSTGEAIRYAIIEHTGTADVVTSDVVDTWVSTVFTPGNFFIAGINVLKTGLVTPGASVWGDINDWSVLGASVKNVIVFFWTDQPLVQNGTLEINRPQYEPGVVATPHEWRMNELFICQQFCESVNHDNTTGLAFISAILTGAISYHTWTFKQTKRAVPAISLYSGSAWNTAVPNVWPSLHNVLFRGASSHFYASGSPSAIAALATCEL